MVIIAEEECCTIDPCKTEAYNWHVLQSNLITFLNHQAEELWLLILRYKVHWVQLPWYTGILYKSW